MDKDTHVFHALGKSQVNEQIAVAQCKALPAELLFQLFDGIVLALIADCCMIQSVMPAYFHIINLGGKNANNTGLGFQNNGFIISLIQFFDCPGEAERKVKVIDRFDQVVHGRHFITPDGILLHRREKEENNLFIHFTQFAGSINAVEVRHFNIKYHNIIVGFVGIKKTDGIVKGRNADGSIVFLFIALQQSFVVSSCSSSSSTMATWIISRFLLSHQIMFTVFHNYIHFKIKCQSFESLCKQTANLGKISCVSLFFFL